MGEQSSINSWLENRVFVYRHDNDAFCMYADRTEETDRVQAKIEGILSSNKSISAMDIYAELAQRGFDDRAIYNWSQTEEVVNQHMHPILHVIASQFRDEKFVKKMKNFNHGTSGLHISGDVHFNSNSMDSIPSHGNSTQISSHGNSTQVNIGPAPNLHNSGSANRPNHASAHIIDATIDELLKTGIRALPNAKTAFGLLQKISTNLENAKFDSLSSLVEWAKEHPNDTLGVSEFLYKVFDQHEAKVGEDRLLTVQKSIEKAINKFTTRQGGAFEIREYDVLGSLLGDCSMSELLAFAECNIKPGVHPADATPVELFFKWLLDLKQNFHDFPPLPDNSWPIHDNAWLDSHEFMPRYDSFSSLAGPATPATTRIKAKIESILSSDKNISIMGIYAELAKNGVGDYDIIIWAASPNSKENPVLNAIAQQFQDGDFIDKMKSLDVKKPGTHIVGDVHLSALRSQKTATADDYHQAFIRAGYTETEIKQWCSLGSSYTYSGDSYLAFRDLARTGAYERAAMKEKPALP